MPRQLAMFDRPPRPAPRKLMHVCDAGDLGCGHEAGANSLVMFECGHCGYRSGWLRMLVSKAKRGFPCPTCNAMKT